MSHCTCVYGCSLCQVQSWLLRAAPSRRLVHLCVGSPDWKLAQVKSRLSRKRKRISSRSGSSHRSKTSCIGLTGGAVTEVGIRGRSRGEGSNC